VTPVFTLKRSQFEGIWYVRNALGGVVCSATQPDAFRYAHSNACEISLTIDATVQIEIEGQGTFAISMRKVA
jgi:hypothetical protein